MDEKLLKEVKRYIEHMEFEIEGEHGVGRSIEELIKNHEMPPLYSLIIEELEKVSQNNEGKKECKDDKYTCT